MTDERFDILAEISPDAPAAMKELYSNYDKRIYEWAIKLWDPELGGFYHCMSARETEGFLPDIESTQFLLKMLNDTGMAKARGGYAAALPKEMSDKVLSFVNSLADPDGYYYHPQWGKIIKPSKKGRDLIWAQSILANYKKDPIYPFATEQMKSGDTTATAAFPEYFSTAEKLRAYFDELWVTKNSYVNGQTISAQTSMVVAAGLTHVEEQFFAEMQNKENGLWEDEVSYNSISGLLKIGSAYNAMKVLIPNWERTLDSAIAYVTSDDIPHALTGAYNATNSIDRIITNLKLTGNEDKLPYVQQKVRENAVAIIKATARRIASFRRDDGGFSYFSDLCCPSIQGCPAGPGRLPESDADGTLLSINAAMTICELVGVPRIPMFDDSDMEHYLELIPTVEPVVKINPRPSDEVMKIKL